MRQCGVEKTGRDTVVNTLLAAGKTPTAIEREMRAVGSPMKAETVRRHLERCLGGKARNDDLVLRAAQGKGPSGDFARMVRDAAAAKLEAGELRIRTQDGIAAQALLDRREERRADRDLLLNLARLLSGGQPVVVEGRYTTVAPLELVAGD